MFFQSVLQDGDIFMLFCVTLLILIICFFRAQSYSNTHMGFIVPLKYALQKGIITILAYFTTVTFFAHILFSQNFPNTSADFFKQARLELDLGNKLLFIAILIGVMYVYYIFFSSFSKRFVISSFLLAAVISFFLSIGLSQYISDNYLFRIPGDRTGYVLMVATILFFLYCSIELFNGAFDRKREMCNFNLMSNFCFKRFLLIALTLFIAWLPYIVMNYPGSVCYDSRTQLYMAWGFLPMSNNSPVFDTMLYGLLYRMGSLFCGTDNGGIAFNTFFQLILFSLSFAYFMETLFEFTCSRGMLVILIIFYTINPIFGGAVQILLKDSLHLSVFIGYITFLIRMQKRTVSRKSILPFCLLFLLTALTRKASIPYTVSAALMLTLLLRHHKSSVRILLLSSIFCIIIYFCFEEIIIPLAGIDKGPSKEFYALPIQIISYITRKNYTYIPQEQLEQINNLISLDAILNTYDPNRADNMKSAFNGNEKQLMNLFWEMGAQYPLDFIKGFLTGTWKYIFPFAPGNLYYRSYIADFSHGKDIYYVFPRWHNMLSSYAESWGNSSALFMLICPGFYGCLSLFSVARAVRNKLYDLSVVLCPMILILVGLFFTPLNGETRYAYPIIALSPATLLWTINSTPTYRK